MKKIQFLIVSTIIVFTSTVSLMTGCQENVKEPIIGLTSESIPKILNNVTYGGLQLPNGTTTEVLNGGSTVKFKFPKGIFLVGTTSTGKLLRESETEFTCTGGCTKGCDVVYVANSFACSQCDPITIACTGKTNITQIIQGQGFVKLDAGISFVKSKKEAESLLMGPDVLLSIPEVREAMKAFNLKIHGTENPDFSDSKKFREVGVNLFGCLVTYMAPSVSNNNFSKVDDDLVDAASWSCRCDAPANSSGCTKDSGIGYKACISGACTSCTMIVN